MVLFACPETSPSSTCRSRADNVASRALAAPRAASSSSLLAQFANGPTRGLAAIKHAIHASGAATLEQQLDAERDFQRALGYGEDYREGVAAFTAKRTPRFTGR